MFNSERELKWIRILLTIIAIPIIVLIFRTLKSIFIPLVFAVFLSFVFAPLTNWLRKKKLHVSLVMSVMLVIIILLMILSSFVLTAAANSLVTGFPRYQYSLTMRIHEWTTSYEALSAKFDIATAGFPQLDINQLLSPGAFSISKAMTNIMTTTLGISWNFVLIIIFLLFITAQGDRLSTRLKKVMDEDDQLRTSTTLKNVQSGIQKYLLTKTIISLCTATVGMILMALYGVDFILVCGILLFILNFIPNIGSIIASGIPILISFLQSGMDIRTITFSFLIIGTQLLFGNVLEPKIQGDRLNLSPIMVLISLIFWGWVWGIVGMILAVPMTSAINITLLQIDEKNLISAIISG